MNIPQPPPSGQPSRFQSAQLRRDARRRRTMDLHILVSPQTKARLLAASQELLMTQSEFVEWIISKYALGLVIVFESGCFLDGLSKTMERRAIEVALATTEKRVQQILFDQGLVASPEPR